ncbi:DUF1214 domain-containing protein [Streptomyces sp. NPDC001914]|uniref:DUF1214 domain-containing protein n=1 Tax=Streptomyces sp. NPDC001914 TaxID=3364623 RepID=UPI0036B41B7E
MFENAPQETTYLFTDTDTDIVRGDDGALTFHVSHAQPEGTPLSNWLPAPGDDFSPYIRAY